MSQRFPSGWVDLNQADAYGDSFADVYDQWYASITDAEATARFVAARTNGGPVLELGVGSGRLALPLVDAGCTVVGIDGSTSMLAKVPTDRVASDDGPGSLHLVRADMRALPFAGRFDVVLIAFNTLFNLADEAEQADLLRVVAGFLGPDGVLVVEVLDATPLLDGPSDSIGMRTVDRQGVVVTATQLDRDHQTMTGQHLEIGDDGVLLRPWRLRWLTPDQLDRLAAQAGLTLTERFASWDEAPVDEASETHISVYR